MLEKESAALKTTPTTIPQTPHISKNPQKKNLRMSTYRQNIYLILGRLERMFNEMDDMSSVGLRSRVKARMVRNRLNVSKDRNDQCSSKWHSKLKIRQFQITKNDIDKLTSKQNNQTTPTS